VCLIHLLHKERPFRRRCDSLNEEEEEEGEGGEEGEEGEGGGSQT